MNASIRLVTLVTLVVIGSGCNRRDSPSDASWQPSALPGSQPGVASVTFQPARALAGSPVWVAVALTFPAPEGGVEVSLSGDSAIESLPSRITVPAGSQRVVFQIATREFSGDRDGDGDGIRGVRGTGNRDASRSGRRSPIPMRCQTYYSVRLTPPQSQVVAGCRTGVVRIRFSSPQGWSSDWFDAAFAAPQGMQLNAGIYESAAGDWRRPGSTPSFEVDDGSYSCTSPTGRFIVRAADCAPDGTVRQFWVTYEMHCSDARLEALGHTGTSE